MFRHPPLSSNVYQHITWSEHLLPIVDTASPADFYALRLIYTARYTHGFLSDYIRIRGVVQLTRAKVLNYLNSSRNKKTWKLLLQRKLGAPCIN